MPLVELTSHENVAIVRLTNGVTNAVNLDLLHELSETLVRVEKEYRGLVLVGGEKFFCIGFDLPTLLRMDRAGMTEFFYTFNQIVLDIFTLRIPTACAARAHAIGAGAIFVLACDYRFSVLGRALFGLNEVKLGVPAPYLADMLIRQISGDRIATDLLFRGELVQSSDAKKWGIFHELVAKDDVETIARESVCELAKLVPKAFSAAKTNRVQSVQAGYKRNFREKNEEFLDCWFTDATQVILTEGAKKF